MEGDAEDLENLEKIRCDATSNTERGGGEGGHLDIPTPNTQQSKHARTHIIHREHRRRQNAGTH